MCFNSTMLKIGSTEISEQKWKHNDPLKLHLMERCNKICIIKIVVSFSFFQAQDGNFISIQFSGHIFTVRCLWRDFRKKDHHCLHLVLKTHHRKRIKQSTLSFAGWWANTFYMHRLSRRRKAVYVQTWLIVYVKKLLRHPVFWRNEKQILHFGFWWIYNFCVSCSPHQTLWAVKYIQHRWALISKGWYLCTV